MTLGDLLTCALRHDLNFTEEHVKQLLYNLVCALKFLHKSGMMHRDLKPSNILVDSSMNVRLCDFGLTRGVAVDNSLKRKQTRYICTRYYRPPEIILLQKSYDYAADIWSLGCVLSEIICSTTAYRKYMKMPAERILFKGDSCHPLSPLPDGNLND